MARTVGVKRPEVGEVAPEFNLPSAQGGNLRLSIRTARGPVIVAFFRGVSSEEDVEFFESLAKKEDEINAAIGSVAGICVSEPGPAREFQRRIGLKSYILYDYTKTVAPLWGVLSDDETYALPATFVVDTDGKIAAAWPEERPDADELLAAVSAITGLPKAEEPEEADAEAADDAAKEKAPQSDAQSDSRKGSVAEEKGEDSGEGG